MDPRLLAWARAAAARQGPGRGLPRLWLFTDAHRVPDPRPSAMRLPRGLGGIVFRHDGAPDRAALGRDLARICRARRLVLVVAGDPRLAAALGAGIHLRAGRWPGAGARLYIRDGRRVVTSSAHGLRELRLARRAGATLAFLSPAFPTPSHPDGAVLGATRWASQARRAGLHVAALGGIDGDSIGRLPPAFCAAVGAISALA